MDAPDRLREVALHLELQAEHEAEQLVGQAISKDVAASIQAVGLYAAAIAVRAVAEALDEAA